MAIDLSWLSNDIKEAVKYFWEIRNNGQGVRTGKTLDHFIRIISKVVNKSGLNNAVILTDKLASQLPGYFRPHKSWDIVIINQEKLIAAIELKSQVGSIGNNFNNRSEEVLGSGFDLLTAIKENAFNNALNIFIGYIILVEKSENTVKNPSVTMKYFPVMNGFLQNEEKRADVYFPDNQGRYPSVSGISYLERYDLMCKRLMYKQLYNAASVIAMPVNKIGSGDYENLSPETSIETFMLKLSGHCEVVSSLIRQSR